MTKRSRLFLFVALAVIFFVAAPLTVFYSLGWRFDWKNRKIIQPGVFYLKVWPKNCQIYINDKPVKKTDFFFGSVMIENLLPQRYKVEIKKDGFQTWQKFLETQERNVTYAKNIILFPVKTNFSVLSQNVEKIYFSNDGRKIITQEKANATQENANSSRWEIKTINLDNGLKSRIAGEKDVVKEGGDLIDFKISYDSQKILLLIKAAGKKEKSGYYLGELDRAPASFSFVGSLDEKTEKVDFNPSSAEKLLFLNNGDLKELNLLNGQISSPFQEKVITFSWDNSNLYYLGKEGAVFKTTSSLPLPEKINTSLVSIKKDGQYQIIVSGDNLFLKENSMLYRFSSAKKSFEAFSDPAKGAVFSSDSRKMAYFDEHEIKILFTEENFEQPRKPKGAEMFLTRFSEKIGKVLWLNSNYLLFSVAKEIKIAGIDDRDKINIFDIADFENPDIFFVQGQKKIFILTNGEFLSSDDLIP